MENDLLMKVYNKQTEAWKLVKKDQNYNKQLTTIEETLARFGLLKNEIRVYLYLARSGEKKAGEIAEVNLTSPHRNLPHPPRPRKERHSVLHIRKAT